MSYQELKRKLGIKSTAIDTGFKPDFDTLAKESKRQGRRKKGRGIRLGRRTSREK